MHIWQIRSHSQGLSTHPVALAESFLSDRVRINWGLDVMCSAPYSMHDWTVANQGEEFHTQSHRSDRAEIGHTVFN